MSLVIYDCDLMWHQSPLYYKKFKELDFLIDMDDNLRFRLLDTDFYIYLTFSSFLWVLYGSNDDPVLLKLEDVMDKAPDYAIEKIIFHLDLFKNEKRIGK